MRPFPHLGMPSVFLFMLSFFMLAPPARAAVDMGSAGYAETWLDYEAPVSELGGPHLLVSRVYKSRSTYGGLFGFGWCSPFETSLRILPDGGARVSECGSGQSVIYSAGADKKFFTALGSVYEKIVFDDGKKYYTRTLTDGSFQRFDQQGRLILSSGSRGGVLRYTYEQDRLVRAEDEDSRTLRFKYGNGGKISEITSVNGMRLQYEYSPAGDLLSARVTAAEKSAPAVYRYEYDGFHNLTRAVWPDGSAVSLRYEKSKDWVMEFAGRDGCTEKYRYEVHETALRHTASVRRECGRASAGKPVAASAATVATEKYEFWYQNIPLQTAALRRARVTREGKVRDVHFDARTGRKESETENGEHRKFTYDENGALKTRSSDRLKVEYTYVPGRALVESCRRITLDEKGRPQADLLTTVKYGARDQIVSAENSDGKRLKLNYDGRNRVVKLTNQDQTVFDVEYDERHGKPAKITASGMGSVELSYNGQGELRSAKSPGGALQALKISAAYEKNMEVLNPVTRILYR